jgi:hypothetical protein
VRVAKDLVSARDNVFFVKQGNTYTLWVSYAPNSGDTAIFKGKIDNYFTDNSKWNYDYIVRLLAKNMPVNKVVTIPIYDYVYSEGHRAYDIYGGDLKPSKKAYALREVDGMGDNIISFFSRAGEARAWLKMRKNQQKDLPSQSAPWNPDIPFGD